MALQFSSLPSELRHQIYDLALDRKPRVVEVEVRAGRVVPKTPPPALLHLNREARDFTLRIYKPWLPQFTGTPVHAQYAAFMAKYRHLSPGPVSCLDDVCFDMERDTLLCKSKLVLPLSASPWPISFFGHIEQYYLKRMAVNFERFELTHILLTLLNAKNLETLWFLDVASEESKYSMHMISRMVRRLEKSSNNAPLDMNRSYVAPSCVAAPTRSFLPSSGLENPAQWYISSASVQTPPIKGELASEHLGPSNVWTTYKYSPVVPDTAPLSMEVSMKEEKNSRKRKADQELDVALAAEAEERANRTQLWVGAGDFVRGTEEIEGQPGIVNHATSSPPGALSSSALASEASSSSQSEVSSSQPASEAGSVRDEDDNSEASDSELEDDAHDEEAAARVHTPRHLHAHRFNYDIGAPEILVEWEDSPEMVKWEWVPKVDLLSIIPVMIATFIANNLPLETGIPVRLHERNSGVVGFDFLVEFEGYPEEIYWTWVPETNLQARVPDMVDRWMIENAAEVSADENVDEQILAEQNYAEKIRGEEDATEEVKEEERDQEEAGAEDTDMKDGGYEDAGNEDHDDEERGEEAAEYVPKRFVAQRETLDGPEILVEWEDWPDEKDFTWEPVSNLQEDAPEMMKAWKASRKPKKVLKVYEVETILGKRKIKGEWHYLVKWKGFSKDEAKSLEPCEKLAVDVPELVEAFENRKTKRRRRRGV
jgi:hypothetical protein